MNDLCMYIIQSKLCTYRNVYKLCSYCVCRDNRLSQRIAINARRDGDTGKQFDDC